MFGPNRSQRRDLVAVISLTLLSVAAAAQENAVAELEEVVVTAQKRTESIQDVPVSITALSAKQLAEARIDDASALTAYVPNLQVSAPLGSSTPVFSLRGVSMSDYSLNQASPVASYVDEVYKGNIALFGVQLYDLERVEVLRGPQGTLYGKNSTGGAINFVTRHPDFDTDGYVKVGVGNYNRTEAQGAFGGALVEDRLAGRIAFTYAKADGWFENLYPGGRDLEGVDEYGVRASLLYKATENLNVTLRLATSEQNPINYGAYTRPGESGVGGGVYSLFFDPVANPNTDYFRTGLDERQIESNFNPKRLIATDSAALTLDWELSDNYALTSITSWDEGEMLSPEDGDGSPLKVLEADYLAPESKQLTQDLRITSSLDGRFNFIAGVYLANEKLTNATNLRFFNDIDVNFDGALDFLDCVDGLPLGCEIGNSFEQERNTWALYFDSSYELTDSLKLRVGLRQTNDKAEIRDYNSQLRGSDGVVLANLIPGDPDDVDATMAKEVSDDELTGKLGLDYTTENGTLLYASYSHGYRAGAFNSQAFFQPEELTIAGPEKLDAYEVGVKGQFAGGRVQLGGAAFIYKYKDQQFQDSVTVNGVPVIGLQNTDQSTIKGLELELLAKPIDRLTVTAGLGLLNAKVDEDVLQGVDVSGNDLPLAPELTGTLAIVWEAPLNDALNLALRADGAYTAKQYFDLFNTERIANDAYTLLNARVAIRSADNHWEVAAWGRNLTDELYYTYGLDAMDSLGLDYFHLGAPRTYGVEASWRF